MFHDPVKFSLFIGFLHILSVNLGGCIMPAYIKGLGGSDALVGHIIAAFFVIRGTLTVSTGTLLARINPSRLLPFSLGLFGISQYSYTLCTQGWQVVFCVLIQAVAAGIYWPTILTSIALNSKPDHIHRNQSYFFMIAGFAALIASLIGGRLAQAFSPRVPYLIGAVAFTVPFALSLFHKTKQRTFVSAQRQSLTDLIDLLRPFLALIALSSMVVIARSAFHVGYALRLITLGGDYQTVGTVYGCSVLLGSIMLYSLPRIESRMGIRVIILFTLVMAMAGLLGNAIGLRLWLASLALPILYGAMQSCEVSWLSYIQKQSGTRALGVNTGLLRGFMDWMTVIFSSFFGLLSDQFHIGIAFLAFAICLLPVLALTRRKLTHS